MILQFSMLDPYKRDNLPPECYKSSFQKQLAIFKFFIDLFMKFDIEAQISKSMGNSAYGPNKAYSI